LEKITEEAWTSLEGQVKEVISEAGYEVNNENLDTARWLLENQLPITKETYSYKKELEELKTHADMDTVLKQMLEGMKNGVLPTEASLISNPAKTEQIVADLNSIQPEAITEAIKSNSELTIKKLTSIQEALTSRAREPEGPESTEKTTRAAVDAVEDRAVATDQGMDEEPFPANKNSEAAVGSHEAEGAGYEEIRAKRQLEEIRLKMTLEAAAQLEKKGFSIETRQLEEVVDALRELEDNYYQRYFLEAGTEATELSLQTLKDTTQSIEALKYLPNYILGSTLSLRSTQTIPGLLAEGSKLQSDLSRAGMAYETLMTLPNREYGDSIAKAFANMGSLLEELKIENTESNQRAVRILGYNRMEITQEAIEQVKAYDLQVNSLIQNLHPAVTVRMIKDGINPLETPIQELNRIIDNMKEEQGITTQEKFSTYLRNLEKTEGLTDQERKAYIGIYRLLYNVEKSDGAALGAVIHSNREVTLENLLSAVQTMKKGRLDSVINDEFGLLQKTAGSSDTMAAQLSVFAKESGHNTEITAKEAAVKEQTQYLERILRQMTEELSPEQLREAGKSISLSEAVWQQELAMAADTLPGIWETIKDTSVEKLYDYLKHTQPQQAEEEVYEQRVHQLRELGKNAEQSLRFLNDYRVPSTPMNVMLANHILSNGESPIKKLLQLQDENIVEKSENSLKDLTDLSDTLIDKHSMEEAYTELKRDAKAALHQVYSEEKIDARKLAELKSIGQQLTFLRQLAEKEFYQIPVETAKGVTNMNLTIIRGSEASQKVMVTVWSEQLGNVKAEFTLKNETLKGFISSDSRIGLDLLEKNADGLRQTAEDNQLILRQLDFGLQLKDNDNYSSHSIGAADHQSPAKAETERTLYQLAKAIVRFVSDAEDNANYAEDAV
jgi:HAMP domain-containing protein